MITYPCPHPGCDHEGEPIKSREVLRAKAIWLCESCGGILPIRIVQRRKKRWRTWAEAQEAENWKGYR